LLDSIGCAPIPEFVDIGFPIFNDKCSTVVAELPPDSIVLYEELWFAIKELISAQWYLCGQAEGAAHYIRGAK
jgi:hypothetical protein